MNDAGSRAEVVIRPSADAWASLSDEGPGRADAPTKRKFREELGLAADRPIIMSGHQCAFWHPGILAKWMATTASAAAHGWEPAWVWVDHDDNDPLALAYPRVDDRGSPAIGTWRCGVSMRGVALRSRPAVDVRGAGPQDAHPAVGGAWAERVLNLLRENRDAESLAVQTAKAVERGLGERKGSMRSFAASRLAGTSLFAEVVERMAREPERVWREYNRAVAASPRARMRALRSEGSRFELPLWRTGWGQERRGVWSDEVSEVRLTDLAPRALLMTGMLRFAGCDIFVHGLGGAAYDEAGETWLASWAGWRVSPKVVVSATLRLGLGPAGEGELGRLAERVSAAHRALHDPGMVGDASAAEVKQEALKAIARSARSSEDRRAAFRAMHAALADYRTRHGEHLRLFEQQAADARLDMAAARVALVRTWPWLMYPQCAIDDLSREIGAAWGGLG
ncbi:MAG: hypothetical protein KIT24_06815 [Phycisphaeraceae bacterium]|nr:hypothetical protein [Phycisphaeraceae bacterium]